MTIQEESKFSNPIVSVVVCAHRTDRYQDLVEAIMSLVSQSYANIEIIAVIDGNEELYSRTLEIAEDSRIQVSLNELNLGLSESRNRGVSKAKGDIIAFFDDDAIADKNWVAELVKMYQQRDAIAAGGRILPLWLTEEPKWLPGEFYWLIGATHKGFPEEIGEVRNTFGSNLSFRSDVLRALGGFRSEIGFKGKGLLQSEETEICERMRKIYGRGVIYNNKAIVCHKVFPERLKWRFLLARAFWHGYSKRVMLELGYSLAEEGKFLAVLLDGIIERIKSLSLEEYCQTAMLVALTSAVALGYAFRATKSILQFGR
jgi:glycosyltransferase involved in cell wall biosynthesis